MTPAVDNHGYRSLPLDMAKSCGAGGRRPRRPAASGWRYTDPDVTGFRPYKRASSRHRRHRGASCVVWRSQKVSPIMLSSTLQIPPMKPGLKYFRADSARDTRSVLSVSQFNTFPNLGVRHNTQIHRRKHTTSPTQILFSVRV